MENNSDLNTCLNHPDQPARWLCSECGRGFCEQCVTPAGRNYYCDDCLEKLDIEEPAPSPELPDWPDFHQDANFVKRMLAFGYDFVLDLLLSLLFSWLLTVIFRFSISTTNKCFFTLLYLGLLARDQATPVGSPGKYLTNLYVWNFQRDAPATWSESLIRNVFWPVFYFDLLTIPLTEHYRRVGDLLGGTVVCDRQDRVDETPYIYRLAGLVGALLVALFLIFAYWFAQETSDRVQPDVGLGFGGNGEVNLKNSLRQNLDLGEKLRVTDREKLLIVTGEFNSAENYYVARRKIDKIIEDSAHEIVADSGPRVLMRGPDKIRFKMKLKFAKE